jgi:hypothetical protein
VLVKVTTRVILVVGIACIGLLAFGVVTPVDLLLPGTAGPSSDVIRRDFPHGHQYLASQGYDGQQYYAIAADLPDLDAASQALDAPRYRLLRILGPAVASVAPRGDATVLALLALNVIGLGLTCGASAELARRRGWPPGLGYLAGVPLIVAALATCMDPLATGLCLTGIAAVDRRQYGWGALLLALGALTREGVAAIALGAALVTLWETRRWQPAALLAASVVPIVAWYLYLGHRVGGRLPARWEVLGIRAIPAQSVAVTVVCFIVCVAGLVLWRRWPLIAMVPGLFVLQIPMYSRNVLDWGALPRVSAPGLALGLVAIGSVVDRARRPAPT